MTGHSEFKEGVAPLRSSGGDNGGGSENLVVETFDQQRFDQYGEGDKASSVKARDYKMATDLVVTGTLGAEHGRNRGLGNANETDLIIAFDHKASSSVDQPVRQDGLAGTVQTNKQDAVLIEAVDVRNSRSGGDVSGTLQSKSTGGHSLNYQNPIALHYTQDYNQDRIYDPAGVAPAHTSAQPAEGRKFATQSGVRRLTPVEVLRLQGFEDTWMDGFSDSQIYRCAGNAVTVSVSRWIAERIVKFWSADS